MKRVLLIIACSLVAITLQSAEKGASAAPADSSNTLAILQGASTSPTFSDDFNMGRNSTSSEEYDTDSEQNAEEGANNDTDDNPITEAANRRRKHRRNATLGSDVFVTLDGLVVTDPQDGTVLDGRTNPFFMQPQLHGRERLGGRSEPSTPLIITSQLGELLTAITRVAYDNSRTKVIPAAALPVTVWVMSRTPWAKELFPALFPRSGTSIIACSLAVLAGAGGWWALKDTIRAGMHTQEALQQMELSKKELDAMAHQIEALRNSQFEVENRQKAMAQALQEAKENAARARQGLEGLQAGVEALTQQIKGDLGNAVHVREVTELKKRVTDLEALLGEITLDRLQAADAQAPDLDAMAQQAQELAAAAQRFARTDDKQANKAFADAAVKKAKKKRFGLW